jgi:transcriptional regulator with XRE-family HTH domain
VKTLRLAKGWSQEQLGEKAGLSYKFIGEIERGIANPSMETLFALAAALGVDATTLFGQASSAGREFSPLVSQDDLFVAREALESLEQLLGRLDVRKRMRALPARSRKARKPESGR